jgi:hypothetical protein
MAHHRKHCLYRWRVDCLTALLLKTVPLAVKLANSPSLTAPPLALSVIPLVRVMLTNTRSACPRTSNSWVLPPPSAIAVATFSPMMVRVVLSPTMIGFVSFTVPCHTASMTALRRNAAVARALRSVSNATFRDTGYVERDRAWTCTARMLHASTHLHCTHTQGEREWGEAQLAVPEDFFYAVFAYQTANMQCRRKINTYQQPHVATMREGGECEILSSSPEAKEILWWCPFLNEQQPVSRN